MSIPNHQSSFHSWLLTPQERTNGTILTTLQKQCIQNHICNLAEERISLPFTPNDPLTFQQRDAELQGQIGILKYLITLSEEAEKQATQLVINDPDSF
jgi:hypothetical protein